RRRQPGPLVDADADSAPDVGEAGIDDVGIENSHEGAQGGAHDGDPAAQGNGVVQWRFLVSMVASTDMPGRRRPSSGLSSITILPGTRCTILMKLPVALSAGSSENSWPLAGEMLSTWPLSTASGKESTTTSTGCPAFTWASCVSL